jgi:hypothetical protein
VPVVHLRSYLLIHGPKKVVKQSFEKFFFGRVRTFKISVVILIFPYIFKRFELRDFRCLYSEVYRFTVFRISYLGYSCSPAGNEGKLQEDRQCTYNVILRGVHKTIVAVEKQ